MPFSLPEKNLSMQTLLNIPRSNADAFSMLRKVYTDQRASLSQSMHYYKLGQCEDELLL